MPRACAASAARTRESRSPCGLGTSTGTAAVPAATSRLSSVRLNRKSAPASAPRRSSSRLPESTLTRCPASRRRTIAVSRWSNGVPGRQPMSMTSAPCARNVSARASKRSSGSNGASTISAKIRMSWRDRSGGNAASPEITPADQPVRPARVRTSRRIRCSTARDRRPLGRGKSRGSPGRDAAGGGG